ncbi:DUF3078 domain-containing protein [Gaoshiqia sediminis]|uniref:DUF3078 domain-containing protein n=1 Tax=Gaoshiqia sediminis TaxID=2986998 RepID=A0AA42C5I0_9BACT|nr:DUF3078 domain-containing protein [Gaoshiqia sediminis]MCW0481579.1 DUF3078 domain-containing protein [Gaoshiqia sediminis]
MKKFLMALFCMPLLAGAQAPADSVKVWKTGGFASLSFTQVSLSNWVAGGKSSASGTLLISTFANYQKDRISWENSLDMGYGILKEGSEDYIKSDDKIDFNSKIGLKSGGNIFYSALFNFRSQFTNGYNYPDRDNPISRFLAPGYFTLALGADYKPNDQFSLFVSPLTGKLTVVTDDELSDQGAFGVDIGKKSRSEMGAFLKAQFKTEVVKNVNLETKADFFSNYLDKPGNIDIHWDVMINMKINDYLSANVVTNLIYDDDVKVPIDDNNDGIAERSGSRVQFKELFGVGLNLKF